MKDHLVFVYGTLRKGEKYAYFLNGAECLELNCTIEGQLYDTGSGYPALLEEKGELPVIGELYKITSAQLKELDKLEGYEENGKDNLYKRIMTKVKTKNEITEAIVYVMPERKDHFVFITDNDWVNYRK